uniref:Si:ch211-153a8.4 n=1 Tax=Cyprinus carpio TaxID=7962 RepID=A0A8C1X999_CYPCA
MWILRQPLFFSLSTENEASSGNNSGARRKSKALGTIVKSRYMQTETKAPQQSMLMPPTPSSPRVSIPRKPSRRTESSLTDNDSALEASNVGGNVFQSTVLDGHCIRPDFDVSVIKGVVLLSTADPNTEERDLAMETFLLAFLTAKIEHNTRKMREEAERNILAVMEKEQQLSAQVNRKKRQYLLLEKQKHPSSFMQIEALAPVAAAANTFAEEYKSFTTAIDATRHKLPGKNVHIGEDAGQFLDKAVECLNQSAQVLEHYTKDIPTDCEASTECLREMKHTANEISQQLTRAFWDLLEVSSLVSREKVVIQQNVKYFSVQNLFMV